MNKDNLVQAGRLSLVAIKQLILALDPAKNQTLLHRLIWLVTQSKLRSQLSADTSIKTGA